MPAKKGFTSPTDPVQAKAMVERYHELYRAAVDQNAEVDIRELRRRGMRLRSPSDMAYEQLAEEEGVKPESIKCKLQTCRNTLLAHEQQIPERPLKFPSIEDFGLPVPKNWMKEQDKIRKRFAALNRTMASLEESIDRVMALGYPRDACMAALAQARRLRQNLADASPVGLCRYCKGLDPYQSECASCQQTGVATAGQLHGIEARYTHRDPLVVLYRGQPVEVRKS